MKNTFDWITGFMALAGIAVVFSVVWLEPIHAQNIGRIQRETVYGIPPSVEHNTILERPETTCETFVRKHQWQRSNLCLTTKLSFSDGWVPVSYCTNCGVLRIEVGK